MQTTERMKPEVAEAGDLPNGARRKPSLGDRIEMEGLQASSLETLRLHWASTHGIEPLPRLSRELLIRGIAYRMQEQACGGLSKKLLRRLEQLTDAAHASRGSSSSAVSRAGTRLVREWEGRAHEVIVLEEGFLWNGSTYGSLSEIARLITGTRWSGPRFFGLQEKGSGKAR